MAYRDDPIEPLARKRVDGMEDSVLIDVMQYTVNYKEKFWDLVKRWYPDYYDQIKWYGDMDAVYNRIWTKYKRGDKK